MPMFFIVHHIVVIKQVFIMYSCIHSSSSSVGVNVLDMKTSIEIDCVYLLPLKALALI